MAKLRLDLDTETFAKLLDTAVSERRPIVWQAEVMLRRALGLPFPPEEERDDHAVSAQASKHKVLN